jgi:hypothetical protein
MNAFAVLILMSGLVSLRAQVAARRRAAFAEIPDESPALAPVGGAR